MTNCRRFRGGGTEATDEKRRCKDLPKRLENFMQTLETRIFITVEASCADPSGQACHLLE
jgi:hypothetical protein